MKNTRIVILVRRIFVWKSALVAAFLAADHYIFYCESHDTAFYDRIFRLTQKPITPTKYDNVLQFPRFALNTALFIRILFVAISCPLFTFKSSPFFSCCLQFLAIPPRQSHHFNVVESSHFIQFGCSFAACSYTCTDERWQAEIKYECSDHFNIC